MKNIVIVALLCLFGVSNVDASTFLYKEDASMTTSRSFEANRDEAKKDDETMLPPDTCEHEYVDLGLPSGTLWAKTNVGAKTETDTGLYFAWGETTGYTDDARDGRLFDWASYKWGDASLYIMTKYCVDSNYGIVDKKKDIEAADDAATANWGGNWQMPSDKQIKELFKPKYTTCTWTKENGVYGTRITSKRNGNSIFLPACGSRNANELDRFGYIGVYWTRSLALHNSNFAHCIYLEEFGLEESHIIGKCLLRFTGQSVRPVRVQK